LKKLLIAAVAAGLMTTGANLAIAAPGPNGNNDHGLCTAYFNGQKKGWEKKETLPPPFAALEKAADDGDDDTSTQQDVYNYCTAVEGGIGGNPEHGRYPSCFDDGDCDN
jgi:hypothetical protein